MATLTDEKVEINSSTAKSTNIEITKKCIKKQYKALSISNAGMKEVNGLYCVHGQRNGYVSFKMMKTSDCDYECVIYCNPNRGWTITKNSAVVYYSYPLTRGSKYPPTPLECESKAIEWKQQTGRYPLPTVKVFHEDDGFNLLFVGYFCEHHQFEVFIPNVIVNLLCKFLWSNLLCERCHQECDNVVLSGTAWFCNHCSDNISDISNDGESN
eukprot:499214_1